MNQLQIIENQGHRVLLTSQLAESYGTDSNTLQVNFSRNKDRFVEGKHFILLQGEELKDFKRNLTNCHVAQNVNKLYLWTEKGAFLHAKSLNTDEAWEVYDKLVDSYFNKVKILSEREQLIASMKLSLATSEELTVIKTEVAEIKEQVANKITLDHGEQQAINHAVKKRIESIFPDYQEDTSKPKLYSQIHSHLRRAFAAPSYRVIKSKDFEEAMAWIKSWRPLL